jgi:hypothetical protein
MSPFAASAAGQLTMSTSRTKAARHRSANLKVRSRMLVWGLSDRFLSCQAAARPQARAKARARWHESGVLTEQGAVSRPLPGLDEQRESATNHRSV